VIFIDVTELLADLRAKRAALSVLKQKALGTEAHRLAGKVEGVELAIYDVEKEVARQAAMRAGLHRIAFERQRQLEAEGWTARHDAEHKRGELAIAAACYAVKDTEASCVVGAGDRGYVDAWPWAAEWDKRSTDSRLRRLEKAGALIAAEIDRLVKAGET